MHNVQMQIADDSLLICVGLKPPQGLTKTAIIASTMGNVSPHGRPDARVALLVYTLGPNLEMQEVLEARMADLRRQLAEAEAVGAAR